MNIKLSEDNLNAIDAYELWADLRKSESSSTYEELYLSIFMSHVNERNYQLLTTTLRQFETFEVIQQFLMGEKVKKEEFIVITGLLINYISSAIALRESTRNISKNKKLFPTELREQSVSKLQREITSNPNIKVIEDIRNIITHQSIIVPTLSFVANKGVYKSGYSYSIKHLLSNDRLTKVTREFLLTIEHGNLFLRPLIDNYHFATANYQNWLISEALKIHKKAYPSYWIARNKVSFEWGGDLEPLPPNHIQSE